MSLSKIELDLQEEINQAAAIADIMCVFNWACSAKDADVPLDAIPDGMNFIYYLCESHKEKLSKISELLTDYIKITERT